MFIKLHVKTKGKQYGIKKISHDLFEITVIEKPESGIANEAVLQLVARHLNIPKGIVRLVKGSKSQHKIIEIP